MLVDRKQPSSCRTIALRSPLPFYWRCQPAYLISKATILVPIPCSRTPSWSSPAICSRPIRIGVHAPVSASVCIAICLHGSYLCLYGERTQRSGSPEVIEPQQWAYIEWTWARMSVGRGSISAFSFTPFSTFPSNLIVLRGNIFCNKIIYKFDTYCYIMLLLTSSKIYEH